jgi:transcriptional regulator with XRE-family HTH domain
MPPTLPTMSPYRFSICLLTLGWSERELSRRTGEHRNTLRRWLAGESAIDPDVAAWLETLVAVHIANPAPRRRPVSIHQPGTSDNSDGSHQRRYKPAVTRPLRSAVVSASNVPGG